MVLGSSWYGIAVTWFQFPARELPTLKNKTKQNKYDIVFDAFVNENVFPILFSDSLLLGYRTTDFVY